MTIALAVLGALFVGLLVDAIYESQNMKIIVAEGNMKLSHIRNICCPRSRTYLWL